MGVGALNKRAAVFLDRDGVINRNVLNPSTGTWESPLTVEGFEMMPNALVALRALRKAGFLLFVVSNQPNYAKAKATLQTLEGIHKHFLNILSKEQIEFAAFYYCLHHPQGVVPEYSGPCRCRKPSPFFLLQARDVFCLDMKQSWMLGDRDSDIECGLAAGVRTIRVFNIDEGNRAASGESHAEFQVNDLEEAVTIILDATKNCAHNVLEMNR
jgi:D-glycero-D-manno-heptose 1,7-bisphosphate phosphatase